MDQHSLAERLGGLAIGEIRYFDSIGSTNDEALAWATSHAQDLSIVVADEQTAGRGRLDRKWSTPSASAIAMSVILKPARRLPLSRTVGWAALAITDSLLQDSLTPQIKWPNDVLIRSKKVAGILIETVWSGDEADAIVIGMGMNVSRASLPPAADLRFPATTLEHELGAAPDRITLVHGILAALIARRPTLETGEFLRDWEERLAFRGQVVQVSSNGNESLEGKLIGLNNDGSLRLQVNSGAAATVHVGDVSLRPC